MSTSEQQSTIEAHPVVAYDIEGACRAAGNVSRRFLFMEMAAGRLRSKKAGKRVLIPAAWLAEWLAAMPDRAA